MTYNMTKNDDDIKKELLSFKTVTGFKEKDEIDYDELRDTDFYITATDLSEIDEISGVLARFNKTAYVDADDDLIAEIRYKESENLFPVHYDGKDYFEKDCDTAFLSFYHSRESLNGLGGVYLSDGLWVYPDGSMSEF